MGAGNPNIKSYDPEYYQPNTYFIDFTESLTEKEMLKSIKENFESNDRDNFKQLTDEQLNEEKNVIINYEVEWFINDYFFNLEDQFKNWFHPPEKEEKYESELSSSFRGSAVVLAMNEDCLILTTDEAENWHCPFALVPNFKFEDIAEDCAYENQEKEQWYEQRDLDFEEMVNKKSLIIYNKKLKIWKKEYEPFMKYFFNIWGKQTSLRSGPYTSFSISAASDTHKFLS